MLIPFLCMLIAAAAQPAAQDPRVTIESDGWVLVGNVRLPAGRARVPAVVMLNGAARDRRAYISLAQELADRGVASLRLDLRGEGESTNLGRFEPGQQNPSLAGEDRDVAAALAWLRRHPRVDGTRIGVLGASYSGESMAVAARRGAAASAYVALSPGSFSGESAGAIDASGRPWWFIASRQERFARAVVEAVPSMSLTARVTIVDGTSHASDILSPHGNLNAEIADWFAARLGGRAAPALWGGLEPGAYDVGFARRETSVDGRALLVDTWYPSRATPDTAPMAFREYVALATDLRDAADGFPATADSVERTLSTAISGDPEAIDRAVIRRVLSHPMLARRSAAAADRRFPLVMWTPRYATTVAQSVLSEFLASHGFVVAFARPATGAVKMPYELQTPEAKGAELAARVEDMAAAVRLLERDACVDATRIGTIAWSYTGEMATAFQMREPRVTLVAGLSTTLLNDWVYRDTLATLDASKLTAAYAVLTQRGPQPAPTPPALASSAAPAYFVDFPDLAHGSFNALEGYIPALMGIDTVQRWSRSGPPGIRGYEAMSLLLLRLLRQHVSGAGGRLAPLVLTSGFGPDIALVR